MQNWIKEGLTDWDITRDISWGIPIPADGPSENVFYGWFDNHLAYISSTIKFLNDNDKDGKKFWNESDIYHFIGKDIVYHHYLKKISKIAIFFLNYQLALTNLTRTNFLTKLYKIYIK